MHRYLLSWLPKIHDLRFKGYNFILDSFNFITCFSSTILSFPDQLSLHNSIRPYYQLIRDDAKETILLNIPPQSFVEAKEPLYLNVQADEQPPPPPQDVFQMMPMEPPKQQTTDFTTSFDTSMNDGMEDFSWFDL